MQRFFVYAAIATAIVGGFALAADALVVSDEEAVGALLDVAHDSAEVLAWTDPELEPVMVQVAGRTARFEQGDELRLADALTDALGGAGEEVVQRSVHVDGDQAQASVRTRSGEVTHNIRFRLTRHGQSWLVTRVVTS